VEIDPYSDNYVPVTACDEQFAEAVGELPQDNGLNGRSGRGMPSEAGDGHNGPLPEGAAGVDAHFEQATGNSHVAAYSGPPMGSMQGFAEASAAQSVQNPVFVVARGQPSSVSMCVRHQLARCQEFGAGYRIHQSSMHSRGCRIRVWDIRQHRLGE